MFTETRKKNWAQQHLELLLWTPNEQFLSKMKLSLNSSQITPTTLTIGPNSGVVIFKSSSPNI